MNVRAFVGKKDDIWSLYYSLPYTKMDLTIADNVEGTNLSEIRVDSKDYIHAIAIGLERAGERGLTNFAWVSPDGRFKGVNRHDANIVRKNDKLDNVAVFNGGMAGICAIESLKIKEYLNEKGIPAITSVSKDGIWQVIVNASDYCNALFVGAKFVDGHDYRQICWNNPVNESVIGVKELANIARNELDDVLEA